jgi:mitogen-activated protein kinase organizer 1
MCSTHLYLPTRQDGLALSCIVRISLTRSDGEESTVFFTAQKFAHMPSQAATRCSAILAGHKGAVNVARFNSDGQYCLTGGDDRVIRLWNPHRVDGDVPPNGTSPPTPQRTPIKSYASHNQRVFDVAIAADNHTFASAGGDKAVFVWDVTSGAVLRRLTAHEHRVNAVRYNADCSVLVSASYDKTVRCWDLRSRSVQPIQTLAAGSDSVSSLTLSAHEIVTGSIDGSVRVQDLRGLTQHASAHHGACFPQVRVHDLRRGEMVRDELGPPIGCVALSHDRNCVLAATLDHTVRLLDKASGQVLCEYRGHSNGGFRVEASLSRDDARVLCGSEDGTLHAWDLVEGKALGRLECHSAALVGLDLHPSSSAILTASHDGTAKMWQPPGG